MRFNEENTIRSGLASNRPIIVTFTKEDGTERVMKCTWNLNLIPLDKHPHEQNPRKDLAPPTTYARVFDLDLNEWRSFRWDSVIGYRLDTFQPVHIVDNINEL